MEGNKTTSRLLLNRQQETHDMLRERCSIVAMKGGTFSIRTHFSAGDWYTDYEINWPKGLSKAQGADHG